MNKTFISKLGIMFAMIFSFLLSIIPGSSVKALEDGETYQTYVDLNKTTRNGSIISFETKDTYNVSAVTYEYTFLINDVLVSKLVQREEKFNKIDSKTYSIDLSAIEETVEGVKIQKIKYTLDDKSWVDKRTVGNNYIGNMESKYKYNYVEISNTELVTTYINSTSSGSWNYINYQNKLYFKFADLVPEDITKMTVDYDTYTNKNTWFGAKSENTDRKNVTYEVTKEDYNKQYGDHATIFDDLFGKFEKVYAIQKSDNEKYDWSVLLPETTFSSDKFGATKYTEVIENACVIKMSYLTEGTYYEDIPVLSDDSGWIYYKEYDKPKDLLDRIIEAIKRFLNWLSNNMWLPISIILIIALAVLISLGTPIIFIVKGIWIIIKLLFKIISLPFKLIGSLFNINKDQKDFNKQMKKYEKEKNKAIDKEKKKELKKINKHGYNRNSNYYKR